MTQRVVVPSDLPKCWRTALGDEFEADYFSELQAFVSAERAKIKVFPPISEVYSAFNLTPLEDVRVVILGQDPYHDDGQAHGLSFSVQPGVKIPPSLRNIFKELEADLGIPVARDGCLKAWAEQGVLLLNTVLTVREHAANSHRNRGWERFTDTVIAHVNAGPAVVFVLWGKSAQKKSAEIDRRHLIVESAHPSPLSAHRGFLGSKPFSQINAFLEANGGKLIDWDLS
ncbi:MAG: uracil-DNA glycosylase [Alphaproteobacteria bacterium]|jgi:uracil-DNA glycosylase